MKRIILLFFFISILLIILLNNAFSMWFISPRLKGMGEGIDLYGIVPDFCEGINNISLANIISKNNFYLMPYSSLYLYNRNFNFSNLEMIVGEKTNVYTPEFLNLNILDSKLSMIFEILGRYLTIGGYYSIYKGSEKFISKLGNDQWNYENREEVEIYNVGISLNFLIINIGASLRPIKYQFVEINKERFTENLYNPDFYLDGTIDEKDSYQYSYWDRYDGNLNITLNLYPLILSANTYIYDIPQDLNINLEDLKNRTYLEVLGRLYFTDEVLLSVYGGQYGFNFSSFGYGNRRIKIGLIRDNKNFLIGIMCHLYTQNLPWDLGTHFGVFGEVKGAFLSYRGGIYGYWDRDLFNNTNHEYYGYIVKGGIGINLPPLSEVNISLEYIRGDRSEIESSYDMRNELSLDISGLLSF